MIQPQRNASISANTPVQELVTYIRLRDEQRAQEAFRELHRRFDGTIRALLMHLIGLLPDKVGDVEELHQDIFLRVWLKLPSKVDETPFEPWLRTVAKNVALDYFRRKKLNTTPLPEDEQKDEEKKHYDMVPFSGPGPEEQTCRAESDEELQTKVKGVLARISRSKSAYLCATLYFIWGFTQSEIADSLCIDKKRVSDYVCKGREELRRTFSHLGKTAETEKEGGLL